MTDPASVASEQAIHVEVLKVSYRQTKDGVVVGFLLHPNDVPDKLATAALGSRWYVALVELNDDETPKS